MTPPRILVADDDAWILRMVTTVLHKRGYTVETASDGAEAYEKATQNPPDLLITDVMMPHMDGWALIKALRTRPEFAFVPVIFLTALSSDDDRIRGFRLGADDYLAKPFRFEELDLRVAKTLAKREQVENEVRQRLASGAEQPAPPPVPTLAGNLSEVGISSLLTLLEMERKTGVLVVSTMEGQVGRIALHQGQPLAARIDGSEEPINEDAIYLMLQWGQGRFDFHQQPLDIPREITASTTHILLEAARIMDESA